jgi:DNA-binding transcriptional MerR regulator
MAEAERFTLTEIARRLGETQHRLIHLCEKEVVVPDIQDAAGRGSSRLFSARNLLEFGIALRLREMMVPVSVIRAILYVLRSFEATVRRDRSGFSLPEALRGKGVPDLRVILSDGEALYFTLGEPGKKAKLFGGVPIDRLVKGSPAPRGLSKTVRAASPGEGLGGPEGSRYSRLEVSITQIAQDLPLD